MVWNRQLEDTDSASLISGADYADLRARTTTLEDVAAIDEVIVAPVVGTEQPSFARLGQTSGNLFEVLGIEPLLGRILDDSDQLPLDPDVPPQSRPPFPAMISYDYWTRTFGADPDVIGRTIRTFTFEHVIVGVLPESFSLVLPQEAQVGEDLGAAIDLWGTYRTDYTQWDRDGRTLRLVARLADGVPVDAARAEVRTIAAALRQEHAVHREQGFELDAEPLLDARSSHLRPLLMLLSAAVLCVLLVACVNASGLLLTRTVARREELEVRQALGAGRFTIARLMLVENFLLALIGGVVGLAVAQGGIELLEWLSPAGLPQASELRLNRAVVLFALAIVPFSALVSGLVPMARAWGGGAGGLASRSTTLSRRHRRLGEALVTTQIALTVLLLVGTGLMLRSFHRLQRFPLGFNPERVITVDISTVGTPPDRSSDTGFADWIERRRNQERALSQTLASLPGVEAAGAVFPVPLNGVYARTCSYSLEAEGRERQQGVAYFRNAWPGYFGALEIPLLAGRDFDYDDDQAGLGEWGPGDDRERTDSPRVIVDSRLASRLWPGESPVGRRLTFAIYPDVLARRRGHRCRALRPAGRDRGRDGDDLHPAQLLPLAGAHPDVEARRGQRPTKTGDRRYGAERVSDSPIGFKPLEAYVGRALASTRFVLTLLGAFAATALLLASIGLYGTMALMVRTRTSEFGLHMALGAPPDAIGKSVVTRAVVLSSVGVAAGWLAAVACSRFLSAYLVEISPTDPRTFAVAAALQVVVAVAAGWIPARRAAAVDPASALRAE